MDYSSSVDGINSELFNQYQFTPSGMVNRDLVLDCDYVNSLANKLNECTEEIAEIWHMVMTDDIEVINSSWDSDEMKEYIQKLMDESNNLERIVSSLRLLVDIYKQIAREGNMVADEITSVINNLF